jgi:short-subunit dehydrogenase
MHEMKPLALVTGASSGIGLELARQFATHDFDVVVTAEDAELAAAAADLRSTGAAVHEVRADLRSDDGVRQLWSEVTGLGRPVDAAALNAGVGRGGAFLETDLQDEFDVIDLNVRSTVHLAKLVLRDMATRDRGKVLVTSSIASTMPGSFQAVYNASKSFLQSFTEALQNELKETGITLTSLMPGPTETEFFARADMLDTRVGRTSLKDDAAQVAEQGFAALMKGDPKVVAGSLATKVQGVVSAVLPDKVKAAAHRLMAKPKE